MERIMTLKQVAAACGGTFCGPNDELLITDVVTDSRKISEGSVFVALKGEKFDGHNFVKQSYDLGAICCVVNSDFENTQGLSVIMVEDTYAALRDIASYYRTRFSLPSVAITGSVGKTSTKDMVAEVLNQHYKVLKTDGNFNNEIGLPLTAFRLSQKDEIAVFEMGMSAFGEISRLSKIALPETAIITNIGFSHIEHLGSQENILKAKLEILDGMSPGGTVILNADDEFLNGAIDNIPFETLSYGIENKNADMVAYNIKKSSEGTEFDVKVEAEEWHISVNVPGLHHVYNALSAILTGLLYNMPMEEIVEGIATFRPSGMRQNAIELSDKVIVKDCYNASPTSMKSGLEVLSVTPPKNSEISSRRVAVLGDMLELGDYAEEAHRQVGRLCCEYELGCLIAIGPNAKFVVEGAIECGFNSSELYVFYDNNTAKEHINEILKPNDVVLFKGSRGMRLEEIADFVAENAEG
ncbi:MAG: UDP-N-acetylmuramoyl-tripeptide--D-alanyl-D-alanine ligase [Clostridia bacterium]|nr:UDP-N-acetylmuramoyl-tripeptide--D-alanyl-D-alanine ligase [Clostridia bacterium]